MVKNKEALEYGFGRLLGGTAKAVNRLLIVVEPGRRSVDTAGHIRRLAAEIGLQNIALVGNKIRSKRDEDFLRGNLRGFEFLGVLPYDDDLIEADLQGISPYDTDSPVIGIVQEIVNRL